MPSLAAALAHASPPEPPNRFGFQMWLSLGGFGDSPPALLPDATLRKAFDAIDVDGNGSISREELQIAISEGTALNGRTRNTVPLIDSLEHGTEQAVSQMIAVADEDGDGEITFDEYKAMIMRGPPPVHASVA